MALGLTDYGYGRSSPHARPKLADCIEIVRQCLKIGHVCGPVTLSYLTRQPVMQ